LLRKLWHRWVVLAHKIGNFQSRILLTLFYFLVVTPFGLVTAVLGDPLHRRRAPSASAWVAREASDVDLPSSRKQF
jgi:hypothetical protein